jgi:hypothetical protein
VLLLGAPVTQAYSPYPLTPADAPVADALGYLQGQQQADGAIGSFADSAWVVMAAAAAGEDPNTWDAGGDSIVDYLAANVASATLTTDYARMVLAITAADQDPTNFGGTDFIDLLEAAYDGSQIGSTSALNDDAWGIMALVSAGIDPSEPIIANSATFIKTNQNADGGWGWAVGQASDPDSTAAPIMALVAAGESTSSSAIQDALAFIKSTQVDSGGFEAWGATNADTDAWCIAAIVAAGDDPTAVEWQSGTGNDPVDSLISFQNPDGSFNWQIGNPGAAIVKTTACAAQALLGQPYPVKIMTPQPGAATVDVRVEGSAGTVWSGQVTVEDSTIIDDGNTSHYFPNPTALGALDEASQAGGFTYVVRDFGWGLAITAVDGIGDWENGPWWLYRVDGASAQVGADAFELNVTSPPSPPHLEVLFYETSTYSEMPLAIEVDKTSVAVDEAFTATVTYFDDNSEVWTALEGATVHADQDYTTGPGGTVAISVDHDATIEVYAEMSGYIRSNRVDVTIGGGSGSGPTSSGTVTLGVTIIPAVAIEVTPSSLHFGVLGPRDVSAPQQVTIDNVGAWNVSVTAEVDDDADGLFIDGVKVDGQAWSDFETTVLRNGSAQADVTLEVPGTYSGVGDVEGFLIIWAEEA